MEVRMNIFKYFNLVCYLMGLCLGAVAFTSVTVIPPVIYSFPPPPRPAVFQIYFKAHFSVLFFCPLEQDRKAEGGVQRARVTFLQLG